MSNSRKRQCLNKKKVQVLAVGLCVVYESKHVKNGADEAGTIGVCRSRSTQAGGKRIGIYVFLDCSSEI